MSGRKEYLLSLCNDLRAMANELKQKVSDNMSKISPVENIVYNGAADVAIAKVDHIEAKVNYNMNYGQADMDELALAKKSVEKYMKEVNKKFGYNSFGYYYY